MVMRFPVANANLDSRGGNPKHDTSSMKLFNPFTAAPAVGFSNLFQSALYARVPDSMITCRAWDPNYTYVNVRRSPNGELVKAMGNGTFFTTNRKADTIAARARDNQGREWLLFNGHGWALASLLFCEINS